MASSPLISASELLLDPSKHRIVDTRFTLGKPEAGRAAYDAAHIPGAVFVDLERDLSAPVREDRVGGRHPLPPADELASTLTRLGISNADHIVAYDDPRTGAGFYAAHFWWLMRYLGHDRARVQVLDGGIAAWIEAGGSLTSGYRAALNPRMIVTADDVAARGPQTALIDSRAPERFRGDVEPLDWEAGHIPGAVNRNWAEGLTPSLRWKAPQEQAQRFAEIADSHPEIVVYCGSGVSAGGNLLALELAGIDAERVKLYAGSWSDWVSRGSGRPVAKGGETTAE